MENDTWDMVEEQYKQVVILLSAVEALQCAPLRFPKCKPFFDQHVIILLETELWQILSSAAQDIVLCSASNTNHFLYIAICQADPRFSAIATLPELVLASQQTPI